MYASSSSCTFHRPGQESTYYDADAALIYIVLIEKKLHSHRRIILVESIGGMDTQNLGFGYPQYCGEMG